MIRTIDGFHQDEQGDWVAELSCLHMQHVRHEPPFRDRSWVETASGRSGRVGTDIECSPCDRAEMPDGLDVVRTVGPFDAETLPGGLRRDHRAAERTWARVRLIDGAVGFSMETEPRTVVQLRAGDVQPIPPTVPHALHVDGHLRVVIDFLVRGTPSPTAGSDAPLLEQDVLNERTP